MVWGHILDEILSEWCTGPRVPPVRERAQPRVAGGWQRVLDDEDNPKPPLGQRVSLHHHYITPASVQDPTDEAVQV